MASPINHAGGIGGTTGAELATVEPLHTSGDVWYVLSSTGTDAVSPRGKDRNRPLATLAQAYANAAAGDTIVMLTGHSESVGLVLTVAKDGLSIIGEGSGSSRPSLTRTGNFIVIDVNANGVLIDNVLFPATTTGTSGSAKVRVRLAGCTISNCYFQCSTLDDGPQVEYVTGAADCAITETTFISTATSIADQPTSCIAVTNAMSRLTLDTVVMDGGSSGWAGAAAFVGTAAVTTLRAINVDLLNDSDMTLATGTSGYVHTRNTSGSARVVWAA